MYNQTKCKESPKPLQLCWWGPSCPYLHFCWASDMIASWKLETLYLKSFEQSANAPGTLYFKTFLFNFWYFYKHTHTQYCDCSVPIDYPKPTPIPTEPPYSLPHSLAFCSGFCVSCYSCCVHSDIRHAVSLKLKIQSAFSSLASDFCSSRQIPFRPPAFAIFCLLSPWPYRRRHVPSLVMCVPCLSSHTRIWGWGIPTAWFTDCICSILLHFWALVFKDDLIPLEFPSPFLHQVCWWYYGCNSASPPVGASAALAQGWVHCQSRFHQPKSQLDDPKDATVLGRLMSLHSLGSVRATEVLTLLISKLQKYKIK